MTRSPRRLRDRRIVVALATGLIAGGAIGASMRGAVDPHAMIKETRALVDPQIEALRHDWANLGRYAQADATLGRPAPGEKRVVFMGDSITDNWVQVDPAFFRGKPYVDRGIGGQTTPQMLIRFQQDVVALHPAVVVILGGINDFARVTGPSTPKMVEDNLTSMVEIARAAGIRPVLAALLPNAAHAGEVVVLNRWIEKFAREQGLVHLDYYPAMADDKGGLPQRLTPDGVHPNQAGYAIMGPLAEAAIAEALSAPAPAR